VLEVVNELVALACIEVSEEYIWFGAGTNADKLWKVEKWIV